MKKQETTLEIPVISLGMDRTDYSSSVNRWKTYLFS